MKHIVNLRRIGKFYHAYEDDAYVIHAIMGYKVSNGKIGFPISSLGKVQNRLDECKVNYKIIDKDNIIGENDFRNNNKYDKFLKDGISSMNKKISDEELLDSIKNLSDEKVDKIKKYILEVLNEE